MHILNNPNVMGVQTSSSRVRALSQNVSAPNTREVNLNYLNAANRSLVKFRGAELSTSYGQTLSENYFNLPIDEKTMRAYPPDVYQTAAAENLYKGNDVIVAAPTGTGKTAIAHYVISKNLKEGKKTFYTAPLKALSNDKLREFQKIYGDENVGLLTGDRKINKNAPIVLMTTEVYRNMMMQDKMNNHNPILKDLKTVVFDELHYLNDEDRGGVWEQSILLTKPKTQILGLSGTMKNAEDITDWISSTKGYGKAEKVTPDESYKAQDTGTHTVLINVPPEKRHVQLDFHVIKLDHKKNPNSKDSSKLAKLQQKKANEKPPEEMLPTNDDYVGVVDKLEKEDKVPAIFFVFSKRKSRELVDYMKFNGPKLTNNDDSKKIAKTIYNYQKSGKYLGELLDEEALTHGYAIHNAGMLPEQKELVETLFQKKLVKVVFATETLSAGINMPARSTVITSLMKPVSTKVDENGKATITPNLFHQMAGRAGRRGIDERGYTYCMAVNGAQEKGFEKLIKTPSNDIESHLKTDFSFVANMDKSFGKTDFLNEFYSKSLFAYDKDPKEKAIKTKALVGDFKNREGILKDNDFITQDNKPTEKGELLTKINGYEQIPVIDSIYNQDMKGLSAVQLAGYVAGLATMSTEEQRGVGDADVPFEDDTLESKSKSLAKKVGEYNQDVYPRLGDDELQLNTDAMKHVAKWADMNEESDKSLNNWHEMFKGETGFKIKDEGTLFKEITMTTDLLKQISDIAQTGEQNTGNVHDKRYYKNLQGTAMEAVDLINKKPATADE